MPLPTSASAIVVNVTAVNPTNAGFLTVYPTGATLPTAANIDFTTGQTVGNEVTVGLNASQSFTVYYGPAGSGTVDFTADVMGYYEAATTGGSYYVPVAPDSHLRLTHRLAAKRGPARRSPTAGVTTSPSAAWAAFLPSPTAQRP